MVQWPSLTTSLANLQAPVFEGNLVCGVVQHGLMSQFEAWELICFATYQLTSILLQKRREEAKKAEPNAPTA